MRNLEAKFRLGDAVLARKRAEAIGFDFRGVLSQHDTFFATPHGKLKLRIQPDGAWLIHYQRRPDSKLEVSNYQIAAVADSSRVREVLAAALGIIAEVSKTRVLLVRRNIRLHLDKVEGLGDFGEIEAVLSPDNAPHDYQAEIAGILDALQIRASELIQPSYFELIQSC
jgi:adenylate cyclase, class 2